MDLLAAFLLLISEHDNIPNPVVYANLNLLCIELEILDEREAKYFCAYIGSYESDVALVRERYKELKDAPHVSDSLRLPNNIYLSEQIKLNRAYLQHLIHLELAAGGTLRENFREAIKETEHLYLVYDFMRDAGFQNYYVGNRRKAMKKLRDELVGPDVYFGKAPYPPSVPLWRFQEIK